MTGVKLSKEAYAASAIVFLPINSAANPFLYSNVLDNLWKKFCRSKKTKKNGTFFSSSKAGTKGMRIYQNAC